MMTGSRVVVGKKSQTGEKATKIPFSSISLRRCGCIDECSGWIIKVFYVISSRELHEFHSKTRPSVSFWYKLEMPAHKAGGMLAQRSPVQVPGVELQRHSCQLPLKKKTNKAFNYLKNTHQVFLCEKNTKQVMEITHTHYVHRQCLFK